MTRTAYLVFVVLALIAAAIVSGAGVFSGRPLETHEDFVAQTSREMLSNGDALVPTFGGERRLQKPPLMYWTVAGFGIATGERGIPAWVARSPSMVATVLLVWSAMAIGALVFDQRTALLSGGIVITSAGVFAYGGNARPEMVYAALTTLSLYGFLRGSSAWVRAPRAEKGDESATAPLVSSPPWIAFAWITFALAILTKGPQLPALMFVGLSFWLVRSRGLCAWVRATSPALGLAIAAAVAAPWYVLVAVREEGALEFWTHELIGKIFTGGGAEGGILSGLWGWLIEFLKPDYLWHLVAQTLPWGIVFPVAFFVSWMKGRPDLARGRVLFWVFVTPLVGLSLASHSRGYYLLPVLAPFAVLLGRGLLDVLDKVAARSALGSRCVLGLWIFAGLPPLGIAILELCSHRLGHAVGDLFYEIAIGLAVVFLGYRLLLGLRIPWRLEGVPARGRQRGAAYPALIAISVTWTWGSAMALHECSLWSDRDLRVDAFATVVAERAASGIPVLTLGYDRDDLIYQLNHGVDALPATTTAKDLSVLPHCLLVTTSRRLDALVAEGLRVEHQYAFLIEEGELAELVELNENQ
jgi:4-amino-4-deoxy-L-arabinose transferase-like glycosyltransferase